MGTTARTFMKRRHDRKQYRREETEKRNKAWQKLSPAEQLAELDDRLGKGEGAKRQRARIQAKLNSENK